MVCFIHRPEYYGIPADAQGNSYEGIAEIIISKHRNCAVGDVRLKFKKTYAKFLNLTDDNPFGERDFAVISSKMNNDFEGEHTPDILQSAPLPDYPDQTYSTDNQVPF